MAASTTKIELFTKHVFESLVQHLSSLVRMGKQGWNLSCSKFFEVDLSFLNQYFSKTVRSFRMINDSVQISFWVDRSHQWNLSWNLSWIERFEVFSSRASFTQNFFNWLAVCTNWWNTMIVDSDTNRLIIFLLSSLHIDLNFRL